MNTTQAQPTRRLSLPLAAAVIVTATGFAAQPAAPSVPVDPRSIAVMAFANLSADAGNEYFADGIAEELLNVLAKVDGLKVASRTSAFSFKGDRKSTRLNSSHRT